MITNETAHYLALLDHYKNLNLQEFSSSPKIFGAATRHLQLVAKFTIDAASAIAQKKSLTWQTYDQLFDGLGNIGVIKKERAEEIKLLANFYLEKTLKLMKVKDVHSMASKADQLLRQAWTEQIN